MQIFIPIRGYFPKSLNVMLTSIVYSISPRRSVYVIAIFQFLQDESCKSLAQASKELNLQFLHSLRLSAWCQWVREENLSPPSLSPHLYTQPPLINAIIDEGRFAGARSPEHPNNDFRFF